MCSVHVHTYIFASFFSRSSSFFCFRISLCTRLWYVPWSKSNCIFSECYINVIWNVHAANQIKSSSKCTSNEEVSVSCLCGVCVYAQSKCQFTQNGNRRKTDNCAYNLSPETSTIFIWTCSGFDYIFFCEINSKVYSFFFCLFAAI